MKVEIQNKEENQEIDWSKPQLVISNEGDVVLITDSQLEKEDEDCFCGLRLFDSDYSNDWIKDHFRPFNGMVTISND